MDGETAVGREAAVSGGGTNGWGDGSGRETAVGREVAVDRGGTNGWGDSSGQGGERGKGWDISGPERQHWKEDDPE